MTQKNAETPEMEALGEVAMSKTELFFEENGKKITVAIFALFVLAAIIFGYKSLIVEPKENRAADAIYTAQSIFESAAPDYKVALEGGPSSLGFLSVIEDYGSTASANIACHYAGVCYLKLGDFDNALKYLKMYKQQEGSTAEILFAQNIGLQGDIAVEKGNYSEAIELFKKASSSSKNTLTAPTYLRKAGMAAQAAGDDAQARELYESVMRNYPSTTESRNAEKYLGTIK